MAPVQADIFATILAEDPDIATYRVERQDDLDSAVHATGADVVITDSDGDDLAPHYLRLLDEHPRLTILAVAADGKRAFLRGLRPYELELGELWPERLRQAVRRAARAEPST